MFSYPTQAGGVLTRVIQAGLEGEPVVFVHGTGARADRFVRNLEPLAELGHRAYAIDLPGHGFAEKDPAFDHSLGGYTKFLHDFVEGLGAGKVTLVGTSLGGQVVANFAVRFPEKVRALVLVGSMGLVPLGEEMRKRIQGGASNQSRDFVHQKLLRVMTDPKLVTDDLVAEEFNFNNSPGAVESLTALGRYIGADLDKDLVGDKLNALPPEIPILLVWGADDKTVPPSSGQAAFTQIERAHLVLLKGVAHTSYFEDAPSFNQVLADFLAGKPGRHRSERVDYVSRV